MLFRSASLSVSVRCCPQTEWNSGAEGDERQENPGAIRTHCGCSLGALLLSSPSQSDWGAEDNGGRGGGLSWGRGGLSPLSDAAGPPRGKAPQLQARFLKLGIRIMVILIIILAQSSCESGIKKKKVCDSALVHALLKLKMLSGTRGRRPCTGL